LGLVGFDAEFFMILLGVAGLFFLIFLCAFFVAAEFSLVAADRSRVEADAGSGNQRAERALRLFPRMSFHLSGAQLGITIVSLLIGLLAEPAVADAIRPLLDNVVSEGVVTGFALAIAIVIATILQMVLGELIPKGVAIARPERTLYTFSSAIALYGAIFGPVIRFLNASANRTVRALGVEPTDELSHVRTLPELQAIVETSSQEGTLDDGATRLLTRAIRFEEKSAEDVLVPRTALKAIARDSSVSDFVALANETGHSRFPVYGNDLDDILGTVHIRSVHSVPEDRRSITKVGTLLRPVIAVPESRNVSDVLRDLKTDNSHFAIVVDEYGGTAGIITLEDILEELVGEIADEFDERQFNPTRFEQGEWLLPGILHLDEVDDQSGCRLPEGEYETLAGFVLDQLGHLPQVGETFVWEDWCFKVEEMDRRRIATVLLQFVKEDS
jgi:CBS domain containing-hemolysin-like protein